ncbi:kynurenine--oxoglutarate transaminase 3-like isoform X2 [Halichondria panicea]|uniref:kynurenine--oxoglutarate transaminase 3-like isoform X2 n=1 Tax=Halichondria panicea TaxID=6063 RepID=UPI00312B64B6
MLSRLASVQLKFAPEFVFTSRFLKRFKCGAVAGKSSSLNPVTRQLSTSVARNQDMSNITPAKRLDGLDNNIWVEYSALAVQTKAINLGQGFPDYSPPKFVMDALSEASQQPMLQQYTRGPGHPRLVKALANIYGPIYGKEIDPMTEVLISCGAYSSLSFAIQGFLQEGDEVILIEPFFDCYYPMAKQNGATVKYVPLRPRGKYPGMSKDWAVDIQELEAAVSKNTKMLVINTPNNPFGKVFSREELEELADVCRRHDLLCVSDEVYEWLVYPGSQHIKIATLPGMWERTITIGSAGKTFHATGWKTGWSIGPANLLKPMSVCQNNTAYTMVTPIQEALAVGLEHELKCFGEPDSFFSQTVQNLMRKRDEVVAVLRETGLSPIVPEGGYFVMADITSIGKKFEGGAESYDFQFTKWMMREKGIASIPPSAFPDHKDMGANLVRFCFCKQDETLKAAYKVLRQWAEERRQEN